MRILIDIGHPAHVHYFRNFIKIMEGKDHKFLVVARNRDIIFELLKKYDIKFTSRGKGNDSFLGKLAYMFYADGLLLFYALKFRIDIFISFSSPYAAQVATIINKPHIALNDTEHSDKTHLIFTYPFSKAIITPANYLNDLGSKQIKIDCVIESFYLHPDIFSPDPDIFSLLCIKPGTKYVVLRFVSWNAYHDFRQGGLTLVEKRAIIHLLAKQFIVYISAERQLEKEFSAYQINIPPEKMHDALAYANFFVSESGTMASESALLGTPVVYVNSLPLMGYLKLEEDNGILKHFDSGKGVLEYINELINTPFLKDNIREKRDMMLKDFINPTKFLTWFIVNYPHSLKVMKENPDYQYNFK